MQLRDGFPELDLIELAHDVQARSLSNADLGLVRICPVAGDIAWDCAILSALGVSLVSEPVACEAPMADIAVRLDPGGTMIELIQVHPEHGPSE